MLPAVLAVTLTAVCRLCNNNTASWIGTLRAAYVFWFHSTLPLLSTYLTLSTRASAVLMPTCLRFLALNMPALYTVVDRRRAPRTFDNITRFCDVRKLFVATRQT